MAVCRVRRGLGLRGDGSDQSGQKYGAGDGRAAQQVKLRGTARRRRRQLALTGSGLALAAGV